MTTPASDPRIWHKHPAQIKGCFSCAHFHGEIAAPHVVCMQHGKPRIVAQPEIGCAFWERAPGGDDDLEEALKLRKFEEPAWVARLVIYRGRR